MQNPWIVFKFTIVWLGFWECDLDVVVCGFFCLDINECETIENVCEDGQCTNTEGSYFCICDEGYRLSPDRTRCIRKYQPRHQTYIAKPVLIGTWDLSQWGTNNVRLPDRWRHLGSGGQPVRELSVVCSHNNTIVARCILDTNIALWDTRTGSAPSILLVLLEPHCWSVDSVFHSSFSNAIARKGIFLWFQYCVHAYVYEVE